MTIGQINNTYTSKDNDRPELGSIIIRLPYANVGNYTDSIGATGLQLDHFLSYTYDEQYLTPADAWTFTLSADELSTDVRDALLPGSRVDVTIDDDVQTIGYLDKIEVRSSRSGGSIITLEGRDWMSPSVDAQINPQTRFVPSMSLSDVLTSVFSDFGFTFAQIDNIANRNAITGAIYGVKTSKKGKPIKSFVLHQEKPYPNEGAFQFASRIAQRFGLWIRPSATFGQLIVSVPDYDQDSRYTLHHKTDASSPFNNVLESEVTWNREEQPSIIFASGFGSGGDFAKATLRGVIVNPLVATPSEVINALVAQYPGIVRVPIPTPLFSSGIASVPIPDPNARPLYVYDSESHTQEQLEAYLRRELSLRMRKSLTAKYTILGHRINGQNVAVDTMVDVDDDVSDLHQTMWVIGRRFSKTLGGGTTTQIDLIRPGSLAF